MLPIPEALPAVLLPACAPTAPVVAVWSGLVLDCEEALLLGEVLLASGVELIDPVLDCAEALESGDVLLAPGVELVELVLPIEPVAELVLEDCDPIDDVELLDSGELPAEESGVAVLPAVPVMLPLDCALLVLGEVELLADELGEELMSEDELALFGGVLLDESGEELVEEPLFGEVLVEEPLLGEVLVDAPAFTPVPLCELAPALPEMLPAVFMSLLALPWLELGLELDAVPAAPPEVDPALALATSRFSFTFFTPATDLAIRLASFLSSLLATVPLSLTVPFSTSTCTFWRFGLVASCS